MQASYFETGRYYAPSNLPRQWPMPAGAYDREAGSRAFRGMVERSRYAEELGFDWVSVSEHHYSPRILTPSLPIAAAYIASHVHNIKIALLGPIVPQSNPVLLAEEMAMLDTMAEGRLIVGMLRGTTNEMLLQLRDDLVGPAAEIDRQRPIDIRRPPPLAGDVALVEFQKRGADSGLQREHRLLRILC